MALEDVLQKIVYWKHTTKVMGALVFALIAGSISNHYVQKRLAKHTVEIHNYTGAIQGYNVDVRILVKRFTVRHTSSYRRIVDLEALGNDAELQSITGWDEEADGKWDSLSIRPKKPTNYSGFYRVDTVWGRNGLRLKYSRLSEDSDKATLNQVTNSLALLDKAVSAVEKQDYKR